MTEKLYERDAYQKEFTSIVTACREEDGCYQVALAQTAFYPEGGGQPADSGRLQGLEVLDVQEKDGEIWHRVEKALEPGMRVTGEIDWEKRFGRMQNHCGEHIVSGLVYQKYGYHNVGFHMSEHVMTVDWDGVLSWEQLQEIEQMANQAVFENISVQAKYPTREELEEIDYRSKKAIEGQVRLIVIPGYDCCACCGTHVACTGEIGSIKILTVQKYKSGVRISMTCGKDALEDYEKKHDEIMHISRALCVKPEEAADAFDRMAEEVFALKQEIASVKKQMYAIRAKEVPAGTKRWFVADASLGGDDMRELANLFAQNAETVMVVGANGAYVIKCVAGDAREIGKQVNAGLDGRGGGKPEMVQGSIKASAETAEKFFYEL